MSKYTINVDPRTGLKYRVYPNSREFVTTGINIATWVLVLIVILIVSIFLFFTGLGNYVLLALLCLFLPFLYLSLRAYLEKYTGYTLPNFFSLPVGHELYTESESDKRKKKYFIQECFDRDQEVFYVLYRYLEFSKDHWKGPGAYKGEFVNYMIGSFDFKIPRTLFERNIDGFQYSICPQDIARLFCGHSKYLKEASSEVLPHHITLNGNYSSDHLKDTILGLVTFSRRMKIGNLTQAHFGTDYYDPEAIDTSSRESYIQELQLKAQVDLELEQAKPERGKLLTLEDRIDMALKEKEEQQNAEEVTALLGKTRKKRLK